MTIRQQIISIAENRILILDGAMGSVIQKLNLGERCNDNLCLVNPLVISSIHESYLEAGADIISTCSFNSTSISLFDYGLSGKAYEISAASARIARESADRFSTSDKPRFVAGSIGPTAKGASLYPDINNPSKRSICWDELEAAYYDNARGLLDGGADILLIETVFDTLNAKAAIFAISRLMEERNIDIPVMISATVSSEAGRLLSGQNLEAFIVSVLHANPLAIGLNCSFEAEKLLPSAAAVSKAAPCFVIAYPNAGLPNKAGVYEESPQAFAAKIEEYFKQGLVNIIGGCCGSTPEHIAAIAKKAAEYKPRPIPSTNSKTSCEQTIILSGLVPLNININIDNKKIDINRKTNPAYAEELRKALTDGEYEDAADIARDIIESGAPVLTIETDDETALSKFLDYALLDPYIAKAPFYIKSSFFKVTETALKRLAGRGLAEIADPQKAKLVERYGAVPVTTGVATLSSCDIIKI